MKLIVGLGNPGEKYNFTRHNIGFLVLDHFLKKYDSYQEKEKFCGKYVEIFFKEQKIMFLKPQKYMNLSGEVIKKYMDYFNISIDDVLVIHDDLDLSFGITKLKFKSGSGGHNGVENIILNLSTNKIKRLKIGISKNHESNTSDYVLGNFSSMEKEKLSDVFEKTDKIIEEFINSDFMSIMNKYNSDR